MSGRWKHKQDMVRCHRRAISPSVRLTHSGAHQGWMQAVLGLVFNKDTGTASKRWLSGEEPACQCWRCKRCQVGSLGQEDPQKRKWQPTPVFLTGKSHGQRSLKGYSPWSCKESDKTEPLSIRFSDFKFRWSLNGSGYKMEHGSRYKNDIFLCKSLHTDPN